MHNHVAENCQKLNLGRHVDEWYKSVDKWFIFVLCFAFFLLKGVKTNKKAHHKMGFFGMSVLETVSSTV